MSNDKCENCCCSGERKDRRVDVFKLSLTRTELEFLRDLMSVELPQGNGYTVSQALAKSSSSRFFEKKLWEKIVEKCEQADLPLGEEAPTFVVLPTSPPTMEVVPAEMFAGIGEYEEEDEQEESGNQLVTEASDE